MAPTLAISDIADFVLYKGNGVKGLAETGIKVLPQQYIQPVEERIDLSKMVTAGRDQDQNIPIIDMSNWENNAEFPMLVCDAAEKWGFFQIINHGVDMEVFDNVKKATHRFYGLSCNEKRKYLKENSGTNNVRFGTSFSPEAEASLEWKDYLSLFYVSDDDASSFWPSLMMTLLPFGRLLRNEKNPFLRNEIGSFHSICITRNNTDSSGINIFLSLSLLDADWKYSQI